MPIRTARLFRDELALPRRWVGFGGEVPPLNLKVAASLVQRKGITMRELTTDELDLVSGGAYAPLDLTLISSSVNFHLRGIFPNITLTIAGVPEDISGGGTFVFKV